MRLWYAVFSLVLIANFIGLGLIYHRVARLENKIPNEQLQALIKNETDVLTRLNGLQSQLALTQSLTRSPEVLGMTDLLPEASNSSISISNHSISIPKNSTDPVNVYKEHAEFSAVLGQLLPDYSYPYYTKLDDWYLVNFAEQKTGWVKAQNVTVNP